MGGFKIEGGTYAAFTSRKASRIPGSLKSSNHKSTSCVTTGAPCSAAAESPTTMKRTLRRKRARRKRSSLSLSEGAATGKTFPETFQRWLFEENERVPHIIRVGFGPHGERGANGLHQILRPSHSVALAGDALLRSAHLFVSNQLCHSFIDTARSFVSDRFLTGHWKDGDTYVFAAGPEYKLLHKNSLDEMCMATPAIAGDRLLIRTLTRLYCLKNK